MRDVLVQRFGTFRDCAQPACKLRSRVRNSLIDGAFARYAAFDRPVSLSQRARAFALVGYLSGRAFQEWGRRPNAAGLALLVGLYSAAIEIGQAFHGSTEGLAWNAFDTGCGALGGLVAGLVLKATRRAG